MRRIGAGRLRRIPIRFEVTNGEDLVRAEYGRISPDQIRRKMITGMVDPRVARLVLPPSVVNQLGLCPRGKIKVRYKDGRTARRDQVPHVFLEILGRKGTYTAVVEPSLKSALIGAIVLEDLDLLVDTTKNRIVPRYARYILCET